MISVSFRPFDLPVLLQHVVAVALLPNRLPTCGRGREPHTGECELVYVDECYANISPSSRILTQSRSQNVRPSLSVPWCQSLDAANSSMLISWLGSTVTPAVEYGTYKPISSSAIAPSSTCWSASTEILTSTATVTRTDVSTLVQLPKFFSVFSLMIGSKVMMRSRTSSARNQLPDRSLHR